jgi:hypothetical protein
MSVDCLVFLRDDRLPTAGQWQAALDRAGTGIVLDKVTDLRGHTGYLPAIHRGQASGFEWYYGPLAEYFGGTPPDGIEDRRHVVDFVTHSDMRELVCGMIAGAVLAQIADGRVLDEDSGTLINGDAALEIARGVESGLS